MDSLRHYTDLADRIAPPSRLNADELVQHALRMTDANQQISIVPAEVRHLPILVPLFDSYRIFYGEKSDLKGAEAFLKERMNLHQSVIFLAVPSNGCSICSTQPRNCSCCVSISHSDCWCFYYCYLFLPFLLYCIFCVCVLLKM